MKLSKTAQLAISCIIFFFVLATTSSFDLAFTSSISSYFFLTNKSYIPFFVLSVSLFLIDIFFRQFDINTPFFSDLSLDAYILFIAGVFLYLRSRKDFIEWFQKFTKKEGKIFSEDILVKFGISFALALLLYPILGVVIAAILGYLFFSYIIKKFDGKIAIVIALLLLFPAAVLIISGNPDLAEDLGNYAFLFLVVGTIQEVVNFVKSRHPYKEEGVKKEEQTEEIEKTEKKAPVPSFLIGEGVIEVKKREIKLPQISFPKVSPRLLFGLVGFVTSFTLLYFFMPRLQKMNLAYLLPKISLPKVSLFKKRPSPSPSPSLTPAPIVTITPTPITKVTSKLAKLKIFVQNGTKIARLAASTSAKLKKAGFENIKIGNAESQDYTNWQLTAKEEVPDLSSLFKNILKLSNLKSKEATIPAGFDVLIIAGTKK